MANVDKAGTLLMGPACFVAQGPFHWFPRLQQGDCQGEWRRSKVLLKALGVRYPRRRVVQKRATKSPPLQRQWAS